LPKKHTSFVTENYDSSWSENFIIVAQYFVCLFESFIIVAHILIELESNNFGWYNLRL